MTRNRADMWQPSKQSSQSRQFILKRYRTVLTIFCSTGFTSLLPAELALADSASGRKKENNLQHFHFFATGRISVSDHMLEEKK
jgi:hypothetical protein